MSSVAGAAAAPTNATPVPRQEKAPAPTVTRFLATLPDAKLALKERDVSVYVEALTAWVVLDMQSRPVNVLNLELIAQVNKVFEELEKLAKAKRVNVVVFTSGKHNSFVAGADIHAMYPNTDQQGVLVSARALQAVFERLSKLPVPTVAAVNGAAMGGGLELALACDYRVCGDHKSVQLGLPEVKIGLLPAAGGCVRLPRVIGLQQALQVILPGGAVKAEKARKIKLVDEVIGSEDRLPGEFRFWSGVRAFATRVSDKRPRRSTEFAVQPNASLQDRLLEGTRLGRVLIGHMAAKNLDKQSKGKYPAPYQALDVVLNSVAAPHAQGLENEAQGIARLGVTPQAKALQSLFLMTEDAKKYSKHIKDGKPLSVQRVGVIGAGVMGAQIATIAAGKGLKVYMRDIKDDFVQKGLKHVQDHFNGLVKRKRMSAEDAKKRIALVEGGTSLQGFARCDLLIEAAVERMDLKKKILQECEAIIPAHCVFATNTSSLSITDLATAGSRPQNVVGLHFFNPVAKMPLVEVIKGPKTSPDSLATAYQLALRLGKIPVICGDGPGFVVNRILGIYMNEAGKLLLEGASVTDIDNALLAFGMPMGPFRLMDEVGLDVAAHVAPVLEAGLGERFKQIPEYTKALQSNPSVLGKKTGQGFYLYEDGKQKGLNSALQDQLNVLVKPTGKALSRHDIIDRAVFVMLNEATAILHEGLVARPADLDLAMVMGTGFAPFTGGLFAFADQLGIDRVVTRLGELEKQFGPRFAPHPRLKEMAQAKQRFFPERPDPAKLKTIASNPRSKL